MKNSLFEYDSYKTFVHQWLKSLPHQGHGQLSRIAKHLGISSVSVSHVFNGPRDISAEQAADLCDFFGFSELEGDYFLLLVQYERAGSHKLKIKTKTKIDQMRVEAQNLKSRIVHNMDVDESAKAQFYSNWQYSALRLASDIVHTTEALSTYLDLPRAKVRETIEFLIKFGLIIEKDNQYFPGPKVTHLSAQSSLITTHHTNWRIKGLQNMSQLSPEELFYTGPMTLSLETMEEIRKDLVNLIDNNVKKIENSKSEVLACLNIDWFKVVKTKS